MSFEGHREILIDLISKFIRQKYDKGQKKHGGDLSLDSIQHLNDSSIEEFADGLVYQFTQKARLIEAGEQLNEAYKKLNKMLDQLEPGANVVIELGLIRARNSITAAMHILYTGDYTGT